MWLKNFIKEYGRWCVALVCIVIACVCFAIPMIQSAAVKHNSEVGVKEIVSQVTVDDIKRNTEVSQEDVTFDYSQVTSLSPAEVAKATLNKVSAYALGLIAVPDVNMTLPIYKGVANDILFYGAGTLKEQQRMGKDNYVLASHNYDSEPNLLFSPLLRSKVGMKVYLTDKDKIYEYQISAIDKVNPEDVWVVDDRGKDELTLITCDDINAKHRFIYRCDLVKVVDVNDNLEEFNNLFDHTITNIDAMGKV